MHLRAGETMEQQPWGKVEGPCIFGGCSEYCCDFEFQTSFFSSNTRAGDAALITKRKPTSLAQAVTETISDADNYTIEYNPEAKLTVTQKLSVVAAQILADYIYFDGNVTT
jgi:hypothetical protein